MLDVLIVGGGASGLALAAMLKTKSKNISVAVAEGLDRVGKKLAVTGNGRCNITNLQLSRKNFHSGQTDFAFKIISDFDFNKTRDFFSNIGLEFANENNKVYPMSFQASSVVDIFRFNLTEMGVSLITGCKVQDIKTNGNYFTAICENIPDITAKCVVIATGGLAGGSKLGSNGDGYRFLKSFGHKIKEQSPVIVQVKTDNTLTRQLKGIKITAEVSVLKNNKTITEEFGEVLFCDYGLSGPPVLQVSRYCKNGVYISLDLLPHCGIDELKNILLKRKTILKSEPLSEFFAGVLHKKLGQIIIKNCGLNLNLEISALKKSDIDNIVKAVKNFSFKVSGNTGFVNAQSTSGGADLAEFNKNLMSEKQKGLFATGEVLDVDGDCGGYNLQWAWSSANAVCNGILDLITVKNK